MMRMRVARYTLGTIAMLLAARVAAAEPVTLQGRTLERDGVRVTFPTVTYDPPFSNTPVTVVCARMASDAIGTTVDPTRDRLAETGHRVVFRDPRDATRILKLYRPDQYDPRYIAKLIQRDLGVQALLQSLGLPVAALDPAPRLIVHGVERQPFVVGKGLDDLYPQGYRIGTNPAVDRILERVATIDKPLRSLVSMQSGLLFTNTVDCRNDRALGVDLGHCYANIFVQTATGAPIFVDW
jgi:hypothetical protein